MRQNLPGDRRRISTTFLLAILALGFTSILVSPPQQANAALAWTATTNFPIGIESTSCVTTGGYIYCRADPTSSGGTGPVYFAPVSSSGEIGIWTSTTSYPNGIMYARCTTSGGYIYCIGGANPGFSNDVFYASLSSSGVGTWIRTTSYPVGVQVASCVASTSYVYCVGGYSGASTFPTTGSMVYDAQISSSGALGVWTATSSYPNPIIGPSCVLSAGYIYCVSGLLNPGGTLNGAVYYASVSSSTGELGPWIASTSYPPDIGSPTCVTLSGNIDCIGGYGMGGVPTATDVVYIAPVSSSGVGEWVQTTSYPSDIVSPSCVTAMGSIYCVGGSTSSGVVDAVYYTTTGVSPTSQLKVDTLDTSGQLIAGYYTVLYQGTSIVGTSFSPATFTLNNEQQYIVQADDYGSCHFDHWSDTGSTKSQRTVSISSALQLTAVYGCVTSTINIATTSSGGGQLAGYYATLSIGGVQVQSCFSPCSFNVDDGQTYQVKVANYGDETFNHWSDNQGYVYSWGGLHPLTASGGSTSTTIMLTAVYDP